jgi:hypothetical protein
MEQQKVVFLLNIIRFPLFASRLGEELWSKSE